MHTEAYEWTSHTINTAINEITVVEKIIYFRKYSEHN